MRFLSAILLIVVSAILLTQEIHRPFYGVHDFNSVDYGVHARNHAQMGLLETKLGGAQVSGLTSLEGFDGFNTHHPMLLTLLIAIPYKIFGVYEWSTRLVPIIFSIGTVLGLYFLGRLLNNPLGGFFSGLFALTTPMFLYFGKGVSNEPLLVCLGVWLAYFYFRLMITKKRGNFIALVILTLVIGFTDWPGYLYFPALLVHNLIFYRGFYFRKLLLLPVILVGTFGWHLFHTYILTGSISGGGLLSSLLLRIGSSVPSKYTFDMSYQALISHQRRIISSHFTNLLFHFALAGTSVAIFRGIINKSLDNFGKLVFFFLIMPILYPIVFKQQMFFHEFLAIYYLPFLVTGAAYLLTGIFKKYSYQIIFGTIFGLIMLIALWQKGQPLFWEIQKYEGDKMPIEMGKILRSNSVYGDRFYVPNTSLKSSEIFFANFYSDRYLEFSGPVKDYSDETVLNLRNKYQYLVKYLDEKQISEETEFLRKNFAFKKEGSFEIYDLRKK